MFLTSGIGYVLNVLFLVLGVFLLVKGADMFVGGASSIAKKLRIPAIVIGLTVVSFGTSAPELAVSLTSSLRGDTGIALGNVVGSNIMNLLVVLGCSCAITPMAIKMSVCKREIPFLLGASALLLIFSMDSLLAGYDGTQNILSRGESLVFVCGIIAFCYMSIILEKKEQEKGVNLENKEESEEEIVELPTWKSILFLVLGLAGIVIGAEFVTTPAKTLAVDLGTLAGLNPELVTNVVGLTVVAVGTSLPELVTSVVAARKGENEIALGNVIGSNIFNILFICGICGVVNPLTMSPDIITDMIISLGATILVLQLCKKGQLNKKNGWLLLGVYAIYLAYILSRVFIKTFDTI